MRNMTEDEIRAFIQECKWGTLIAIDGDKPYAVELAYASDDSCIYCGSMPGGRMGRSVKNNQTVAFKICESSQDMSKFRAVIVEGQAKLLKEKAEITEGLGVLYKKLGLPESRIKPRADQLTADPEKSSFYRIPLKVIGGKIMGYDKK
jgi:nitroimidazol reductase NimA-like FMN-containing flavoprotein (pyridoxamine 5'-phosphate oxidase superfamily)